MQRTIQCPSEESENQQDQADAVTRQLAKQRERCQKEREIEEAVAEVGF